MDQILEHKILFFVFELIFNFVFYLERNANSQAAKSQSCKLCSFLVISHIIL
jgi:hypothetical protein